MNVDFEREYSDLYQIMLREHRAVFEKQDLTELQRFGDAILAAKRIFVMGVGREGIAARAFAMRLMHLGKDVFWIWDDTTPGMGKGDLFIAVNGSGKIGHIHYVVEQAKASGATIAVVTGAPKEKTPALAEYVLFVPACVYKGTDARTVPSVQPMGALFEQHCFMLYDLLIILLEKSMQLTHEQMALRHRNVE